MEIVELGLGPLFENKHVQSHILFKVVHYQFKTLINIFLDMGQPQLWLTILS
jgi:hypothetical protein